MPILTASSVSAFSHSFHLQMLPRFEALEAGMNGNVDTEDVVDKVDQTSSS